MKKLALINLIVLIAVKSVSACSFLPGKEPVSVFEGRAVHFWAMFIGSFLLFVPIVAFYYLRKRRGIATVILSVIALLIFIPAIAAAGFMSMCGDGTPVAAVIIAEFFFMCLLFTIQLSSWISERKTNSKLR